MLINLSFWHVNGLYFLSFFLYLIDGELYAGVYIDFMGTDSAIFRTLGKNTVMRTDQYNSRWLNGKYKKSIITWINMNFLTSEIKVI